MRTENLLVATVFTVLVLGSMAALFRVRRGNPVFWYLPFQWLIGAPTIWVLDFSRPDDAAYTALFVVSTLAFLAGALIVSTTFQLREAYRSFYEQDVEVDFQVTRIAVWTLSLLSLGITVLYYRAVGYNLFVEAVLGQSVADFTSARLAAYSGDTYFAPGYVNQFKNVLLPLGVTTIGTWAWLRGRRRTFWMTMAVGIPLALYALLGTGQRGFLVYAFGAALMGMAILFRIQWRHLVLPGVAVLFFFGLVSYELGRISELSASTIVVGFVERLFVNDQEGGIVGFRYVYSLPTAWLGEWGHGLLGILPGNRGSTMAHDVFEIMHGTRRGTANLTTVASVYHNVGFVGSVFAYFVLGAVYAWAFGRMLRGRRTVLRSLVYGATFFHLAFFVSGAPVALLNKGLLALMMLLVVRRIRVWGDRSQRYPAQPVSQDQALVFPAGS